MINLPFSNTEINIFTSLYNPNTVHVKNTRAYAFWFRSLYMRLLSPLKINVPWVGDVKDFFNMCLYYNGYVAIFENEEFGFCFQPCTLSGYDFYYRPTKALIANPLLNIELTIGDDCEILKIAPDYQGYYDVLSYYAEKLSELDTDLNVALFNEKNPLLMGAKSKASAEGLKKMLDNVNKGNPVSIVDYRMLIDEDNGEPIKVSNYFDTKNNYITDKILIDMQTLINQFDCEIGIPTIPYQKKERLVESEANSKMIDSQGRLTTMMRCFTESAEIVNEHFGCNITIEREFENEYKQNDANRSLQL